MMGITYHDFWGMNPHIIKFYAKQYKHKRNEEDLKQWQLGQYITAAISTIGKGKYPKKPMFQIEEKEIEETGNVYKESKEDISVFEMKQRINLLRRYGLPESPV